MKENINLRESNDVAYTEILNRENVFPFDWRMTQKPSDILYAILKEQKAHLVVKMDHLNALAFAIGQVCALEANTTIKIERWEEKMIDTLPQRSGSS